MPVQILSTGAHLPGAPITNEMLELLVGPLPKDVLDGVQVEQRHWMIDPATGEHETSNSQMAARACEQALTRAGVAAGEVDLLVISTSSPDYLLPPMSAFVADHLGLSGCAAIDVRSGCAGAVEALDIARVYLERGSYRTALVVGSEAISPLLVPIYRGTDPGRIRMRDRIPVYSFGDGAGAVLLRATDDVGPGLHESALGSLGVGRKPGMQVVGAGTHAPLHEQLQAKRLVELKVDVVESGRFTPAVIAQGLADVLDRNGLDADAVDVCVIPEGNAGYLTKEIEESGQLTPAWSAIAGRVVENLGLVGATGSAAVPLALDHAWRTGAVQPGSRVLLLAIETSKWIYAGMYLDWTAAAA